MHILLGFRRPPAPHLPQVSEVYDLWGSSGLAGGGAGNPLTWRLSSTEVKAVLARG